MQLVVPVVQIKGNLVKSGYSGPEKYIIIATPLLLRFGPKYALLGSKLVRKQICLYGIFPVRQLNAIATPFINAMVAFGAYEIDSGNWDCVEMI